MIRKSLLFAFAFAISAGAFASPVAGEFDYYVFSLSWQPAFCATHQEKKECKEVSPRNFDASNLVLHGLWPSRRNDPRNTYGYCDVPRKIVQMDRHKKWCRMPDEKLSSETIKDLETYMPGYQSCLQNHEWYKHGTCTGMNANDYFDTATKYVASIAKTNLGKFISANAGKDVDSKDIENAAVKDYGDKARNLRYICKSGELQEVRLYLDKNLPEKIGADNLVEPDKGEHSSCNGRVHIDEVGAQQ